MRKHRGLFIVSLLLSLLAAIGCGHHAPRQKLAIPPIQSIAAPAAALPNPIYVPLVDRDFLWNQIVDAVDDYFWIERERRVQQIGGVLTDGRIDTFPTIGSTLLEPWRSDSTRGYERLHATLQSLRRQAVVTVAPDPNGYFISVSVAKELEAVDQTVHTSVGASTLRHDNSLVSRRGANGENTHGPFTLGWIPLGRDAQLEQRLLQEIRARVADFQ